MSSGFRMSIAIVHGPTSTAPSALGSLAPESAAHCSRKAGRRPSRFGSGISSLASLPRSSGSTWRSIDGTTWSEYFTWRRIRRLLPDSRPLSRQAHSGGTGEAIGRFALGSRAPRAGTPRLSSPRDMARLLPKTPVKEGKAMLTAILSVVFLVGVPIWLVVEKVLHRSRTRVRARRPAGVRRPVRHTAASDHLTPAA